MDDFQTRLRRKAAEKRGKAEALSADRRQDEADLCKVEENIYSACADSYRGLACSFAGEELTERYLTLLGRMSGQWRASLEKAKAHDDVRRAVVEELKLKTLADVQDLFGGRADEGK